MPVICFEGASAVGKTTLSNYLRDKYGAFIVPEVNFLFERKPGERQFWYFEKQAERWKLAIEAAKTSEIVILDGDPFQPLWYNWSFDFDFGNPPAEILDFYRNELIAGSIDFPDKYYILSINNEELGKRKTGDRGRTRKNFARHLRFIEPQRAFFKFVKSLNNNLVEFIENKIVSQSAEMVIASRGESYLTRYSSLELFDAIENWLGENDAVKFKS
jgi:hypothetical protein